jgi:hypothetical protein
MFGFPLEVVTMLVSTLSGAFMKLWTESRADLQEERMHKADNFKAYEMSMVRASGLNKPQDMSMKKLLVVSVMAMAFFILLAPLFGLPNQVPIEVTEGFKFLFLDFTTTVTEYIELNGVVTPDWLGHAILSVFGLYFGQSIARRR